MRVSAAPAGDHGAAVGIELAQKAGMTPSRQRRGGAGMFRKTILGLAILALAPAVARAQFRTGYTYHMVGDSTMYYCNAPEKKITHHLHMWLYVANDRDLFAFFDATHGLQFDLAKARKK